MELTNSGVKPMSDRLSPESITHNLGMYSLRSDVGDNEAINDMRIVSHCLTQCSLWLKMVFLWR